jgi:hypothetical protein
MDDGPGGIPDGIYATGIRNGFRARWDKPTNRFFIAEVGGNNQAVATEDIHLGKARVNYGWPLCEGNCNNPDYSSTCSCSLHDNPLFTYTHKDAKNPKGTNAAIIGGFVYRGNQFPSMYQGVYFYGDYSRGWIKYLKFNAAGNQVVDNVMFNDYVQGLINFEPANDGSFYYCTMDQIRHVSFASGNQLPIISSTTASVTAGAAPLAVTLKAAAYDPDQDPISFTWYFGNGQSSPGATVSATYKNPGTYTAYVEVTDGKGSVFSEDLTIAVGSPPVASITTPADGSLFLAGETFVFQGTATDANGQPLSADMHWNMKFVHDDHTHPAVDQHIGKSLSFTFPIKGHGFTSYVGYLITLTVTNNIGLSTSTSINVWPDEVDLTFATKPKGLIVFVDGVPSPAPFTMDSLKGFQHTLSVQKTSCHNGKVHTFAGWSKGGAASHVITVPSKDTTYTASFNVGKNCLTALPVTQGLVMHLDSDAGLTATAQGAVSEWADVSGSANHLTVTQDPPKLVAASLNGHQHVLFDGIDDAMGASGANNLPLGDSARTVLMMAKYNGPGWGGFTWGSVGCNTVFGLGVTASTANLFIENFCSGNTAASGVNGPDQGWGVHGVVSDSASVRHYFGGDLLETLSKSGYSFATTDENIRLGVEHNDGSKVAMEVAEVLVYNRALSESERQLVEGYLQAKYLDEENQVEEVTITFASSPSGMPLTVEAQSGPAPLAVVTQPGAQLSVSAPSTACMSGTAYVFSGWSHNEPASHTLVVPGSDTSLTATYTSVGACGDGSTSTTAAPKNSLPTTSGLVMHLATDSGISVGSGGKVLSWSDKTGQSPDLVPPSALDAPVLLHGQINGHSTVHFDGINDGLGASGIGALPKGNADRTAFLVAKYDSPGWGGFSWGTTGCNAVWGLTVSASLGNLFLEDFCSANMEASGVAGSGGGWLVQSAMVSGSTLTHYKDGVVIETLPGDVFATADEKIRLGVEHNDGNKVEMDVAEIVVFSRALSSSELQQMQSYFDAKYFGGGSDGSTTTVTSASTTSSSVSDEIPVKSGIVLYLNGAKGVATSGSQVTSWTDSTAYGLQLTPPASLQGPTLVSSGLNGKPVVSFDGDNDALQSLNIGQLPTGSADRTLALVVNYKSAGWGGFSWGTTDCLQTFGLGVTYNIGNLFIET